MTTGCVEEQAGFMVGTLHRSPMIQLVNDGCRCNDTDAHDLVSRMDEDQRVAGERLLGWCWCCETHEVDEQDDLGLCETCVAKLRESELVDA